MLYDYCCNYIEDAHLPSGENKANKNIYNLCCDYILGVYTPKQRDFLCTYFKCN